MSNKITPATAPVGARLEERAIEALRRLEGFDWNLAPEEAKRLYGRNIQRLSMDFAAVIEACAQVASRYRGVPDVRAQGMVDAIVADIRALADPLAARLGRCLENLDEKVAAVEGRC